MSIRIRSELVALFVFVFAGVARADESSGAPAPRSDDPMAEYRERFRIAMDKYKTGAVAEAIVEWEAIYKVLGRESGYRLSFNLGRAYDAYGDSRRAAERYESYLEQVDARRAAGQTIEAIVEKQEGEARARLAELGQTRGRIKVLAGKRPVAVSVDAEEPRIGGFTAYVAPGAHTVAFGAGAEITKVEVSVEEGKVVELSPPEPPEPARPADPVPRAVAPLSPPIRFAHEIDRPFSPIALYVAGGVTALSAIVPALTYSHALSLRDTHDASNDAAERASLEGEYYSARTAAYATLAIPLSLAAVTGGLTAWYFLGKRERDVPILPAIAPTQGGATSGITGRF